MSDVQNKDPDDLLGIALRALGDVAGDENAPAAARVQAANALLSWVGDGGPKAGASAPVGDLSLADLDAEIARISGLS